MNLNRIKHTLRRLSPEEKIVAGGGIVAIVSCFLPWHTVITSYEQEKIIRNAFSGDLGIIGFVVFLMVIVGMLILLGENLHIRLPQFGYSKEQILFFLMGESAFLILLTMAIYTKRSLDFTNAELRFGIGLSLLATFFGAFAAFSQMQKISDKQARDFFDHSEEEPKNGKQPHENVADHTPEDLAPELFAETMEDEMVEEVSMTEAMSHDDSESDEIPATKNQANFFTREAGLDEDDKM